MKAVLGTLLLVWLILTVIVGLQLPVFLFSSFVLVIPGIFLTLKMGGIFRLIDKPGFAILNMGSIDWLLALTAFSSRGYEVIAQGLYVETFVCFGIIFGCIAGWAVVVLWLACRT
jgi:hypothetical protein